jgi:hypothetical protein
MAEMMVDVAHEDRIATFGREIRVGFAGFHDCDVCEFSFGDSGLDVGQPFGIEFVGEHAAGGADALGCRNGHLPFSGSDFSDRAP